MRALNFFTSRRDMISAAALFLITLAIYVRTLAPSVVFLFDDTLDFQFTIPRLGIAHQTGYPLYTLLGKLFALLIPLNDAAFRLNLFSAICAALAVTTLYLAIRPITTYRLPRAFAALVFAFGGTFWSQAIIAEIYALQLLLTALVLSLALRLPLRDARSTPHALRLTLYALALVMGLGLAHQRLILLVYPAIAIYYLLLTSPRDLSTLARAALIFAMPLLLYAYIPLRGAVGSADGTYANTLPGFWAWVTASQYTVFLTQNPLNIQRDASFYAALFQNQFTLAGLALAAIGFIALWRVRRREWILLTLALILPAGFAFNYKVADVDVFFLTTFMLLAVFAGVGADALMAQSAKFKAQSEKLKIALLAFRFSLFAFCFLLPAQLLFTNYQLLDLSSKWDIHDYGIDIRSQPLEPDATIIGIVGEMTLIRYFQENDNLRPDVQTIAADKEDARLAAIDRALAQNRAVYLTRPLKGAAEKYALSSLGPLIRVQTSFLDPKSEIRNAVDAPMGSSIRLLGYDLDTSRLTAQPGRWHAENGRLVRVTLYWQALDEITADAMVSLKLLGQNQRVVGQIDRRPVLGAYPTTVWREGEVISDTYDVPVFFGAPAGEYALNVTLYDAAAGAVIAQRDLQTLALAPDTVAPRRDAWNVARIVEADFGELALLGFSFEDQTPIRPGDVLPLTFLWHAPLGRQRASNALVARVWLEDDAGEAVASRDALLALAPNAYTREAPTIRVPANIADGKYRVKLAVARGDQLLGSTFLPFRATGADLGRVEIKNRARVMRALDVPHVVEAVFDGKIKLLGYDWTYDARSRQARLTLYWRALALMDTSYTVFVHLLNTAGAALAAADSMPGNGAFPTTGWIENEYIADAHTLTLSPDLPSGKYAFEIGWYDASTGARLKTADGQDRVILFQGDLP